MGIVFRQSIKTSIVTFLGMILGVLVIYSSTKLLPQNELGFSRSLLSQAVVGSQFVLMGMQSALYVFIHKYPEGHRARSLLITISIATPFILTLLFSAVYIIAKPLIIPLYNASDIILVERYFLWLPLFVFLWGVLTILEQFLNSQMKLAAANFLREVVLRIINIIVIVAYGLGYIDFDWFIALSVLVHIVPVAVLWWMARKIEGFQLSTNWGALSKSEYKHIFDFAFFHLLLNMSVVLLDNIDILMIPVLDISGMTSVSIYFIAVFIVSVFQVPFRALTLTATPVLNREFQQKNMEKFRDLYGRANSNILVATLGMGSLIICNLDNGISLLPEEYSSAYIIVLILMLGRTVNIIAGLNHWVISISDYYKFNFYITLFLIVFIILLNYLLIPEYGINGAAWGTTIAIGIYSIIKIMFVWVKFRLSPLSNRSLFTVIAAAVSFIPGMMLPFMFHPIIDTIIRSIVIIIIYIVMVYWLKPSKDVTDYINTVLKNKKLF